MVEITLRYDPQDERSTALVTELVQRGHVVEPGYVSGTALVLGGARSGKSRWAEQQLADHPVVDYVATSRVSDDDAEWQERVRTHRDRRPSTWRTIETLDLVDVLTRQEEVPVLVDCLALWLDRVLDDAGAWEARSGWQDRVESSVDDLCAAIAHSKRDVVLVSNEVGSGIVPASSAGRIYRDQLGRLNARAAAACDHVWLTTAGIARRLT